MFLISNFIFLGFQLFFAYFDFFNFTETVFFNINLLLLVYYILYFIMLDQIIFIHFI